MSTNYYVRPPGTPEGDEGIHLGKHSGGWAFAFRAYPDPASRPAEVTWDVVDFASWDRLLRLGDIVAESGYAVTRHELLKTISEAHRNRLHHVLFDGQFEDRGGNRFDPREFC